MRVEVIGRALAYTWPGGRVVLEPGKPIDLPDERAKKLMKRCPGRVRLIQPGPIDWLAEWRRLATLTYGILPDDPRLSPVLAALNRCDDAFLAGDLSAFRVAAQQVEEAVRR